VHGNLLTLPVGDSFLYVEPLYVASTGSSSSYPTLQRVLVRYGNKIGYGETLEAGAKKPTVEVKSLLEAARLLGAA